MSVELCGRVIGRTALGLACFTLLFVGRLPRSWLVPVERPITRLVRDTGRKGRRTAAQPRALNPQKKNFCKAPMVFDVGMARTGTTTTCKFLEKLGYDRMQAMAGHEKVALRDMDVFLRDPLGASQKIFFARMPGSRAYCDFPFYDMACAFRLRYPQAKFLHVTRSFESHFQSLKNAVFCVSSKWHCDGLGLKIQGRMQDRMLAGTMTMFCRDRLKLDLCGSGRHSDALWEPYRTILAAKISNHTREVTECIPESVRLELTTDTLKDSAGKIASFLNCSTKRLPDIVTTNAR